MKNIIKYGLTLPLALATNVWVSGETLTINIKGAEAHKGKIFIAIFNQPKEFPNGTPIKLISQSAKMKSLKVDIPKGVYAVAVFQDQNNNNTLDLNFFKVPKEKTGTSGKKYSGKPTFSKAAFKLLTDQEVDISLK